ncbi:angiogenic factor with G patch and FHA domains 1-like [Saccostrea cucullata]|uniref:angiogenic factor with G patch and FHA domains 1-like n=1 Tax=Saccostrea cuccullata TaxID=36930 RepID=UPI002ED2D863
MGWSEGESLGKDNTGIQDPVCVSFRMNQKAGLGSEAASSKSLDDVGEVAKNKRWLEAQQRYRKAIADKKIPTPAWVKESKLKPSDFK